jgi:pilus assembly protein CpaE
VTTLAVSLAATLGRAESAEAICLVDLCPSSGHVALQLGLRPQPNWSGLIQAGDLDIESVEAHLLQHGSGLRVLASPVFPVVGQGMPPTRVKALFSVLQQRFPVVVVDTPPVLDEMMMAALESALVLGLVVTAEAPSIQTTVGTLRVIGQRLAPSVPKIQLILNQTTPGDPPPSSMIERTIKRSLAATIPFDPSQARALAQGAPLALRGSTAIAAPAPLAQAVTAWTEELILPALRTPAAPRP